jgi:hypothetical protein
MIHELLPPLVRPIGEHRVGDTIRVTWTFTNFEEHALNDAKLRLNLPNAVLVNPQQSSIGGTRREETALLAAHSNGEPISLGTVEQGESLWLDLFVTAQGPTPVDGLPFSVNLSWENQDWLRSDLAPICVRAFPEVTVLEPQILTQKSEEHRFGIIFGFANHGTMAARELVFSVPAPSGFLISRIGGEGMIDNGDPLRREVRIDALVPNQELSIPVEFVAGPGASDAVEVDNALLSYDGGEALVPAVALRLSSHVDFTQSSLALMDDSETVRPGALVRIVLSIANTGRSDASDVRVGFRLPHELLFADGTIAVNNGVDARRNDLHEITLPLVRGDSVMTVSFYATVRSPIEPDSHIQVYATVNDMDVTPLDFEVDSRPNFPIDENYVVINDPTTIAAGTTRLVYARIHNAGTATADGVRLRVDKNRLAIDKAVIKDTDGRETAAAIGPISGDLNSNIIELGNIEPRTTRMVALTMAAPEAFENGDVFAVRAFLRTKTASEIPIGGVDFRGRSWPVITAEQSEIRALRDDAIRVGQHRIVTVRLENTGSAKAEQVEVDLDLPATLVATHADGAELESGKLVFARILPCNMAAATVRIEAVASHDGGAVEVRPLVSGPGITAFRMKPLTIVTAGRVVFDDVKAEIKDIPGTDRVSIALHFTNSGDRAARNILIALPTVPGGYVADSTRVVEGTQSIPIPDLQGSTLLAQGLLISEMDPSVQLSISLEAVVGAEDEVVAAFTIDCDSLARITAEAKPYRRARQRRIGNDRNRDLTMNGPRILGQSAMTPEVIAALMPPAPPEISAPTPEAVIEDELPIPKHDEPAQSVNTGSPSSLSQRAGRLGLHVATATVVSNESAADAAHLAATDLMHPAATGEGAAETASSETSERLASESAAEDVLVEQPAVVTTGVEERHEKSSDVDDDTNIRTVSLDEATARAEESLQESPATPWRPEVVRREPESQERVQFNAPVGRLLVDTRYVEKAGRFLDLLESQPNLGMYKHLFAMRMFLPQRIDGISPEVAKELGKAIFPVAFQRQLGAIAILARPNFQPTEKWAACFEDDNTQNAAGALLRISDRVSRNDVSIAIPPGTGEIFGLITATYREEYRHATQLGGGHFHRMLVELMPTESIDYPEFAGALAQYRAGLIEALDAFVYQTPTPRHESLARTNNDRLDRALGDLSRVVAAHNTQTQIA